MSFGMVEFVALVAVVGLGAMLPIVPTGAAVSAAAVVAHTDHLWEIPIVVAAGALGAYLGDILVYAALRAFGAPLAHRMRWLGRDDPESTVQVLRARLEQHEVRTLLLSRLVPGGRIPVLLVAALGGYPLAKFAVAAVAAAIVWASVYAAIGVLGGSTMENDTTAVVVVVLAALLVSLAGQLVQRWRRWR